MSRHWWTEEGGLFGDFYMEGDASVNGHLAGKQQSLAERTQGEVDGVVRLLGLQAGSRVLDVPCGYGRHAIELAARGCSVLAVDLNSTHLRAASVRASAAASQEDPSVQFRKGNMLTLDFHEEFDAVLNMFFSFGFFDSDEENMQVLRNFRKALKPGGKFLMHTDVNIPRILSGRYKTDERRSLASGRTLHIEERFDTGTRRIVGAWTIDGRGGDEKRPYSVRVYEVEEFRSMCLEAGFDSCAAYGNWSADAYEAEESEEIIFVASTRQ